MRRKLNEGEGFNEELLDGVKICVSDIRNDDLEMDCNELRDIFVEAGAEVFGSHGLKDGKPATIMTVKGLPEEKVLEILQEFLNDSDTCDDAEAYEVNDEDAYLNDRDGEPIDYPAYDDIDSETQSYLDADEPDYPEYEDIETDDLDPEEDSLNDDFLNEGEDILEDAQEELRGLLSNLGENDNITFEPEIVLDEEYEGEDGEGNIAVVSIDCNGDMEVLNGEQVINAFELTDADDIFTLCDVVKDELDNEAAYPDYDEVDDDEDELPKFEKFHKGRHLDEKKKNNCCPGTKTVNESAIDEVLADLDAKILNESKEVEKKNQKELEKKTLKALTENKHSLHANISYNGKSFAKMTLKELKSIYETVKASVDALSERSLNESVVDTKMVETINKKKQLLEFLDEEITYRTTRMECLSKLNEDSAEISDEELANLFGPAQGEDEPSVDNGDDDAKSEDSNEEGEENKEDNEDENDEEVELSRIEITLKDAEAANDLKQACLDAEIPEDAFELENVEEESATEDEENSEEKSEENSEENPEEPNEENSEEQNSEESANESYEFAKYVKMLGEGEVADEQPVDDAASEEGGEEENGAENAEGEGDEENSEEEEEDKQPKFILTNTDYASKLAKVLEDVYGISKEEFEDMIGGEIVEEEPKEDEEKSDKEGSENSKESKEDSEEKKDDEEDELDPSDLFKNL